MKVLCYDCPLGYRSAEGGFRRDCIPCASGMFQDTPRQLSCRSCPQGWLSPRVSTLCEECPPGKYGTNSTPSGPPWNCVFCPYGKYRKQGQENGERCVECRPGFYTGSKGSPSCLRCLPGSSQNEWGKDSCNDCAVNFYSDEPTRAITDCSACPSGWSAPKRKSKACARCAAGFVGKRPDDPSGGSGCVLCRPGKFRATDDDPTPADSAEPPSPNSTKYKSLMQRTKNFTDCIECPSGWSTAGIIDKVGPDGQLGSEFCLACSPGRFSPQPQDLECTLCAFGKYVATKAATSCRSCTSGEVPGSNRASCIVPGWTIPSNCRGGQYIEDTDRFDGGVENTDDPTRKGLFGCEEPGLISERLEINEFGELTLKPSFNKFVNANCSLADGFNILRLVASRQKNDPKGTYFLDDVWAQVDHDKNGALERGEFKELVKLSLRAPRLGNNVTVANATTGGTEAVADGMAVGAGGIEAAADGVATNTSSVSTDVLWTSLLNWANTNDGEDASVSPAQVKTWLSESSEHSIANIFDNTDPANLRTKKIYDMDNSTGAGVFCFKHPARVPDDCNPKAYTQQYDWKCRDCPPGAVCGEDNIPYTSLLKHKKGFWDVPWAVDDSGTVIGRSRYLPLFIKCPFPTSCMANGCRETTGGALCAVCLEGTFREFPNDPICKICTENTTSERFTVAASIILGGFLVLVALRRPLLRLRRKYGHTWKNLLRILAINLSYAQVSTSMPSIVRIPWPQVYLDFLNQFEFINLDLVGMLGMKCLGGGFWDFRAKIVSLSLIPTGFILFTYIVFSINKVRLNRLDRNSLKWAKLQKHAAAHVFDVVDRDQSDFIEQHEFVTILRYVKYNKIMDDAESDRIMRAMGAVDSDEQDEHGHKFRLLKISRVQFIAAAKPGGTLDILNPSWAFEAHANRLWSGSMSSMLIVLFLMHAPISKKLFAYFACHNIGGRRYLRSE